MDALMDPAVHSSTGDAFRSGQGTVKTVMLTPDTVSVTFPAAVAGVEKLFDQVAIVSATSPKKELAVLGPFYLAEYKPGVSIYLRRNPNYWKRDASGNALPYLTGVRLEIQSNRDIEMLKFSRNEIHLINSMDADYFDKMSRLAPGKVRDAGPSLDSEQVWFNQVANAPIPAYKREWFQSRNFRRAVSAAINRTDLCKVVYGGHATPARGPVSPANRFFFDTQLPEARFNQASAIRLLQEDGFQQQNGKLLDRSGHAVEFSIVTNSGNRSRERMATMIQADLRAIGITGNGVTLDFPSLIQRISESFDYEAALLGMTNVELDPNAQMNVWISSSDEHQWNPRQKTPATLWEAEIDRLMRAQASATDDKARKRSFDRVQEIVTEQMPFIYLVNKNALMGVSPVLQGVEPVATRPQTYWNIERIRIAQESAGNVH
jgi:peptide/nickel transport system substrate-binding protein